MVCRAPRTLQRARRRISPTIYSVPQVHRVNERALDNLGDRSRAVTLIMADGGSMGDKGGKKDKEKHKQQQLTKQKQVAQNRHEKAQPRKP